MVYHFLLQGNFQPRNPNLNILHWQVGSLPLCHLGSPSGVQKQQKQKKSSSVKGLRGSCLLGQLSATLPLPHPLFGSSPLILLSLKSTKSTIEQARMHSNTRCHIKGMNHDPSRPFLVLSFLFIKCWIRDRPAILSVQWCVRRNPFGVLLENIFLSDLNKKKFLG